MKCATTVNVKIQCLLKSFQKNKQTQMNNLFNHPLYYIKAFKILYEKCKIYYVNEKVVICTVLNGVTQTGLETFLRDQHKPSQYFGFKVLQSFLF